MGRKRNEIQSNIVTAASELNLINGLGEALFKADEHESKLTSSLQLNEFKGAVDIKDAIFSDNILELNTSTPKSDLLDFGLTGKYWNPNTSTYNYAGLYRDADALGKFYLFKNYPTRPHPSINPALIELADLHTNAIFTNEIKNGSLKFTLPVVSGQLAIASDVPFSSTLILGSSTSPLTVNIPNAEVKEILFTPTVSFTGLGESDYDVSAEGEGITILKSGTFRIEFTCYWYELSSTEFNSLQLSININGINGPVHNVFPAYKYKCGCFNFTNIIEAQENQRIRFTITQTNAINENIPISMQPICLFERISIPLQS
jgi:hypothetical protein